MGLFGKSKEQQEIDRLNGIIAELNKRVTPDEARLQSLKNEIQNLTFKKTQLDSQLSVLERNITTSQNTLNRLNEQIVQTNEVLLLQDFGLYEPKYDFVNSEQYKQRLDVIREQQKQMIKSGTAASGTTTWSINGNYSAGKTMVSNLQQLLIRAFNSECDETISKVKYSNYEASEKRIKKSSEAISKLGKMFNITITAPYLNLKLQELNLAFEYQMMKQKEKEEQKELKARMREEAKLQKEIEEARKKIEKEQAHYLNALAKINLQLTSDPDNGALLAKKSQIEESIVDTEKAMKDIDYREANKRAGYVYIISNIGAFGENVYKIGMTRRLDPQERIDELGDASVPFNFDVHAMIFSDNAPALENALHHAFEDKKLNMVNTRREFFRVSLDEIKAVVKSNYEKTAEFIDFAQAEQYRLSEKMRENLVNE